MLLGGRVEPQTSPYLRRGRGTDDEVEEGADMSTARPAVTEPRNPDDREILDRLMRFERSVIEGTDPGRVREQLSDYIARRGL